jgi:hypothetical protein
VNEPHPKITDPQFADEKDYWRARAAWHYAKADEEEQAGYKLIAAFRRERAAFFAEKGKE